MEELIDYIPHECPEYAEDNVKLLQILNDLVHKTISVSSIKPFICTNNGRDAYNALSQNNMGNSQYQSLIEQS